MITSRLLTLLCSLALTCVTAVAADDRPNVLLIVSEDNGPELGCYGDPYVKTPVLDKLANEGVRFDKAFVPYSVCSPSRACFLTGLEPQENGHLGLATHKFALYQEVPNLFGVLKSNGYRTGLIGKLHVNPESQFEKHVDFRAIRSANFGRKKLAAYASEAAKFFSAGDEPFFLSINYPDAHFPLIPVAGGYPKKKDLLTGEDVKPLPWIGADSPRLRQATADYYNCMSRLDSMIGRLLKELKKAGKADNTLIVYIGDHGAQFSRGKTSVYDAGLRVPFIVHWPDQLKAGQVRDELVSTLDIMPTVLKAAGATAPDRLSGRALQPLLAGKSVSDWRKFVTGITTGSAPGIGCLQFSLRTARYKLIISPPGQGTNLSAQAYLKHANAHFIAGTTEKEIANADPVIQKAYATWLNPPEYELYDLKKDPHEFRNLAADPQYKGVLDQLLAAYRSWQREIGDPFADAANVKLWLDEQERGRKINYRKDKTFQWGYLTKFQDWRQQQSK